MEYSSDSFFTYVQENLSYILEATFAHLRIVLVVIAIATLISVSLGVFVAQRPVARTVALTIAGILLTVPSLALFAFFIPIFGIGNPPAIVALILYAILPILRNTVVGLDAVSPAVVESAKGMGLNNLQQLYKVRLPLAWPLMITGVRISTLLTVGIAAIAPLVGGDGLGTYIRDGLTRLGLPNSENSVYTGVVFTILLGIVLDIVLALFQRLTTPRGLRV